MADKVTEVYQLILANQQFDAGLSVRLNNAALEVANAVYTLTSVGLTNAAAALGGFVTANAIELADYIDAAMPNIFNQMDVFSSIMAIETSLDEANAAVILRDNSAIAFGAVFAGRTFVSSLDDIARANNDLANAAASFEPDLATDGVYSNLNARANAVANIPGIVTSTISNEQSFYEDSATKIDQYALANHIVQAFTQLPTKAVIGAVGSDALLNVLNPPDSGAAPPPPIDGSGSGAADPTPIR